MKKKSVDQFDLDGNYIQTWPSLVVASRELGCDHSNISFALDRSGRSGAGFRWKTSLDHTESVELKYNPRKEYTEEQRKDFNERIPRYMPVLYNLISKYDFINDFNRDDYIQEALLIAWMQFYSYTPTPGDGARFGAWF
ncbi:MAG TPA: NUMOD1 domain-containing DNA-binding protein, partial [Puia sp.]|nr:NUMOD1 domain-containing DNA-binding protein [Puia sp.]